MKALIILALIANAAMLGKAGDSPICLFDGFVMDCYYYSWDDCEDARLRRWRSDQYRCVANPNLE